MQQNSRRAFTVLSALAFVACGANTAGPSGPTGAGGAGGAGTAAAHGLPCDVDALLAANCRTCHGEKTQYGAPMSLVTHDDLVKPAVSDPKRKVYELLTERIHNDQRPMPPPPNARLSDADMKTVDAWIAAGAPISADKCEDGAGGADGGTGVPSCTPDIHVSFPTNYMMPKDKSDEYICAGIEVTAAEKRHITAFIPHIDNSKIVHHIVLYQADTAQPAGPAPCGGTPGRIVSVWAPGVKGFELPKEAGIPVEGTTHYVLQIHYNNIQHLEGETDASGFDLCSTTELRPNDADVLALGTLGIDIPAHSSLDLTCDLNVPQGIADLHIIGAMPHMHRLGTTISTVNHPGGTGAPVDLGTREPWSFADQYWTPLDQIVKGGDKVSTRCAWNNGGDTNVKFGENTENEMCFSFTMYYPKIADPQWNWTYPALLLTTCAPTP
jgi:mono/diheme cytochrome c family protein